MWGLYNSDTGLCGGHNGDIYMGYILISTLSPTTFGCYFKEL